MKNHKDVGKSIKIFAETIAKLNIDIKDDKDWVVISDSLIKNKDYDFQYNFWIELEKYFKNKEKELGHCHKGNLYFQLAVLMLQKGNIDDTISFLDRSRSEDIIKNNLQFTASSGLLSILHPLFFRYKKKGDKRMSEEIKTFYETLNQDAKESFALQLFESHNNSATGKIVYIKPDFFTFIVDEKIRKIAFDTYVEVREILLNLRIPTYFSCIFSIGSVLEAMLDDIFTRNEEELWKLFISNKVIKKLIDPKSMLNSDNYPMSATLNTKIKALRLMSNEDICPIPKQTLLQMTLIGEYRDLIHPRRRLDFIFEANLFVASFLFSLLSQIAGNLWSENIAKNMPNQTHP
jgi:hypothetical protein